MFPLLRWIDGSSSVLTSTLPKFLSLTACYGGIALGVVTASTNSQAQVIPDISLGEDVSIVTPQAQEAWVTGGAIRGKALFHSFEAFNVETGRSLHFTNPSGITHIFSRVTGSGSSQIDGTLGVLGNADLVLLNPSGILFGPHARLDLSGSFTATTAESLQVGEIAFSAIAPQAPPLLTLNLTPGIQLGPIADSSLLRNEGQLSVEPGQRLALLGGQLEQAGTILAPAGEVELRGDRLSLTGNVETSNLGTLKLTSPGDLQIHPTGSLSNGAISQALLTNEVIVEAAGDLTLQGSLSSNVASPLTLTAGQDLNWLAGESTTQLGGPLTLQSHSNLKLEESITLQSTQASDIQLHAPGNLIIQNAEIIHQAPISEPGSASIRLSAHNLTLQDSKISARSQGHQPTADIDIDVANDVILRSGQIVAFSPFGSSNSGDITLQARQLQLDGSQPNQPSTITTTTALFSSGNAGSITLNVTDSIELIGYVPGPFLAQQFTIQEVIQLAATGTVISSSAFGAGQSGNTTIHTDRLSLRHGAAIGIASGVFSPSANPEQELTDPPNVTIHARDTQLQGLAAIGAATLGGAHAGDVMITGELLSLNDGASISATSFGSNRLLGQETSGNAGEISIEVETLQVLNGSVIGASTDGSGNGGMLEVVADTITVQGTSPRGEFPASLRTGVGSNTLQLDGAIATGQGGELTLTTHQLQVLDGGQIIASTAAHSTGNAGNLSITAKSIELLGQGTDPQGAAIPSSLEAQSLGQGEAGQLMIKTNQLIARDGAQIITASQQGNGGDITIEAGFIIVPAGENSDITADAISGKGGEVSITAHGIWGIQARPQRTQHSDITSRSNSDVGIDGQITLTRPAPLDPGTTRDLPSGLLQPEVQVIAGCPSNHQMAQFVVSGRGGLPTNPQHQLQQTLTLEDWRESPSPLSPEPRTLNRLAQSHSLPAPRRKSRLQSKLPTESLNRPPSPSITLLPIEAQGVHRDALGNIHLTTGPSPSSPELLASCQHLPGVGDDAAVGQPDSLEWGDRA